MPAIQTQKTLWRKKWQCDVEDVKSKTKTANPVKIAESKSRTNSCGESVKTKPTWGRNLRKQPRPAARGILFVHNPQPNFFSLRTTGPAESFQPLNSSLPLSAPELHLCKATHDPVVLAQNAQKLPNAKSLKWLS